ncbi:hypothetical protein PG993_003667 [Apiospora rasikravindrae]|uniref:Uncharacterized protein n=1 Tax=Apiospora rasikravindrae TaxID=990691 RepID=A0ABR1U0Q7_9PEZI
MVSAHAKFQTDLVRRPCGWVATWLVAQFIVKHGLHHGGHDLLRHAPPSASAATPSPIWPGGAARLARGAGPTVSGFDDCVCKSSVFGIGTGIRGGYIDFRERRVLPAPLQRQRLLGAAARGVSGSTLAFSHCVIGLEVAQVVEPVEGDREYQHAAAPLRAAGLVYLTLLRLRGSFCV